MDEPKIYLGDGAYAAATPHQITITTENGFETTNRIVLGPTELDAFICWLVRVGWLKEGEPLKSQPWL